MPKRQTIERTPSQSPNKGVLNSFHLGVTKHRDMGICPPKLYETAYKIEEIGGFVYEHI